MSALLGRVRALPSVQVTLAIALLVLGFLIAAQIAAEGPRTRYSTEERSPLIETALGLQAQQEALKADIVADRTDAAWLREAYRSRGSLNDVARMQSERWMADALVN